MIYMFKSYKISFNSNWIMHACFYFMGAMITQIYNLFFRIEYTIIHVLFYILILAAFGLLFRAQYIKYNKDV